MTETREQDFQLDQVAPIAGAHFVHDTYTAFIAPLLPIIIEKLSLSLTAVGSLTAIMQLPALMNPFIGYMADIVSVRYFVILAPAVTATLVGILGLANSYFQLALILFGIGVSVSAFHAPAPAMIARVSGRQVGLGMSLFMAAGELSRAAGPLIAVWAVSTWTLEGIWRTMFVGWAASFILYLRLRHVPARSDKLGSLQSVTPVLRSFFLPIGIFYLFRNMLFACLTTFLPTYMTSQGASLGLAALSLSILEIAGVAGALLSGPLSDRLGRKPVLLVSIFLASILTLIFLNVGGWLTVPVLLILGFSFLATTPVVLAMVQDQMPDHRALGNGIFMVIVFLLQAVALFLVGFLGDRIGLYATFTLSALMALLSIPVILILPNSPKEDPGTI